MRPGEFFGIFGPQAVEVYERTGLFASVMLTRIVQELGWDVHTPKDIHTGKESHNLFGIKGTGPAGSVLCWTVEWDGSAWVAVQDYFRAYPTHMESFLDHADVILTRPWYAEVRYAATPQAQCRALYHGDQDWRGAMTGYVFGAVTTHTGEASRTLAPWFPVEAEAVTQAQALNVGQVTALDDALALLDSYNLTAWDGKADERRVAEGALRHRFGVIAGTADVDTTTLYRALVFVLKVLGK